MSATRSNVAPSATSSGCSGWPARCAATTASATVSGAAGRLTARARVPLRQLRDVRRDDPPARREPHPRLALPALDRPVRGSRTACSRRPSGRRPRRTRSRAAAGRAGPTGAPPATPRSPRRRAAGPRRRSGRSAGRPRTARSARRRRPRPAPARTGRTRRGPAATTSGRSRTATVLDRLADDLDRHAVDGPAVDDRGHRRQVRRHRHAGAAAPPRPDPRRSAGPRVRRRRAPRRRADEREPEQHDPREQVPERDLPADVPAHLLGVDQPDEPERPRRSSSTRRPTGSSCR